MGIHTTDDLELKRKLLRMQRRLMEQKTRAEATHPVPELEDPEATVRRVLRDRGEEVLEAAKQQYPPETDQIVRELARLIKKGEISEIGGARLYATFNELGIPVRLKTTIQIVSGGKTGSIAEKLKEK